MSMFILNKIVRSLVLLVFCLQASRWGRVEWAHDMDQKDLEARFAAGLLFAQLNSAAQHRVAKRDDSAAKHI